jgi:folate-binding protein YgfZ
MTSTVIQGNPVRGAADFGDVKAEFHALAEGCAVYSLDSVARIALTGGDRVRWLNGMVTNNIRDLASGHGVYAFLLNPQGHILGDLYAYHHGDSLLIQSDRSQLEKLLATFDHYIIMDDVEVADVSDQRVGIGVAGPRSRDILQTAGLEVPELQSLQFVSLPWRDSTLTVVRGDYPGIETYELWITPDQAPQLWEALTHSGAKPAGTTALELFRIAAGVPRYGQDIRERDLPQETEQARALHFSKGCYVGQEIVERIRSRGNVHRKFTGFNVQGDLPPVGSKIQADGRDIGEITSTASLPTTNGERSVALGYIRREVAMLGKPVMAANAQLTVATLPFQEFFPR